MNFAKKRYELTFVHKLLIVVLLGMGVLFWGKPEAYSQDVVSELQDVSFPILHAGDYVLEAVYEDSPEGNALIVFSDQATSEDNIRGVEFASWEIEKGSGMIEMSFHLDHETYSVGVKTAFDSEESYYLRRLHLQSVQLMNKDNYFLSCLCMAAALGILLLGLYVPKEKYREPAVLILIGLVVSLPLFSDFLMWGHDLLFHITRIKGIYQGMQAGEFPVRINPIQTHGLGNLSSTMYPQLFLYPAVLLHMAGVSVMTAYKFLLVCVNIGTAMSSFYAVKNICKSARMGWAAGILYTFSIYRLSDVYYRAALGETLAMMFMPLVVWGIYEVLWGDRRRWHILMLGMTGVLQSHVLSVEMCVLFLVLESAIWFFSKNAGEKLRRIGGGLKAAVGTCLLNAGFLVPFLFYSREDLQSFHMESDMADSVVYFSQMFSLFPIPLGVSLPRTTTAGEMSLSIGGILAVGVVLFCIAVLGQKEKSVSISLGSHCLYFGILSIVLSSWLFPWETLARNGIFNKLTTPLQFAWRFLAPATLFLSITAACGIALLSRRESFRWVYFGVLAIALGSAWYFFDSFFYYGDALSSKMDLEASSSYDSLYMYSDSVGYGNSGGVISYYGTGAVYSDYEKKGSQVHVRVNPIAGNGEAVEDYLLFPLYYVPGYEVKINGKKVDTFAKEALVACAMPGEEAYIEVRYAGFPAFHVADAVSLAAAAGMAGFKLVCMGRRKQNRG